MKVAIGIVAHVARHDEAALLARLVKAKFLSVDDGSAGCETNHRMVWSHLSELDAEWSVVVEDDAVPVDGFLDQLPQALAVAPSPVVSLYLGQQRPPREQPLIANAIAEAETCDASWITSTQCLHAVALAVRTPLVPEMLTKLPAGRPSDQGIGAWAQSAGHLVSYSHPSICDHQDGPSLVEHPDGEERLPGRVAWTVGRKDLWTSRSVSL